MKFKFDVKTITGIGLLLAVEIVLQVIGNFLALGPITINLSLIPIVLAAILYGPVGGLILGAFCGILVIPTPFATTLMAYQGKWYNPIFTVLICLLKTSLAGFLSGLIYLPFKSKGSSKELIGAILASICVPLVNTGTFVGLMYLFFSDFLIANFQNGTDSLFLTVITTLVGFNFIFEISSTTILSPAVAKVVDIVKKRANQ